MPLGVDPAELEAQPKWQCQYMPVLRRLLTRNVVQVDQLKTRHTDSQKVKMSFLRRGNSCVAPDMEIRKRLEVSASIFFLLLIF